MYFSNEFQYSNKTNDTLIENEVVFTTRSTSYFLSVIIRVIFCPFIANFTVTVPSDMQAELQSKSNINL